MKNTNISAINKDDEYQGLLERMNIIKEGMLNLKKILQNFNKYFVYVGELFKELSLSIVKIYDNTSPFNGLCKKISEEHLEMFNNYSKFYSSTSKLYSKTSEWEILFSQAEEKIKIREDKKKNYVHYSKKIEKLKKEESTNTSRKMQETIERNEEKFKNAADEFAKSSEESFKLISGILERRYDMVNPILIDLMLEEFKFIKSINSQIEDFERIDERFDEIKNTIAIGGYTYDPWKNIKGKDIIQKVNNNNTRGMNMKELNRVNSVVNDGDYSGIRSIRPKKLHCTFLKPEKEIMKAFLNIPDDFR